MRSLAEPFPSISRSKAWPVLRELVGKRSLLAGMSAMNEALGYAFEITLPGFNPIVLSGPEAARELLVSKRDEVNWRIESDPVTQLLRHGLLVEDGESHNRLRSYMQPALRRSEIERYIPVMLDSTDQVICAWEDGSQQDMLIEMRKVALIIIMKALFNVDIAPDLEQLWNPILRVLKYISPGLWILSADIPRLGYKAAIEALDEYLYEIIRERRLNQTGLDDMLGDLMSQEEMDDALIRDQMLTMLIAGHDTSTTLLSWALYLLGEHTGVMEAAQAEVDRVLGNHAPTAAHIRQLHYLEQIIKESLRLFPPIHAANRAAGGDMKIQGCPVNKGQRMMFSYYLTHRDEQAWDDPERFDPDRFDRTQIQKHPSFSYLPFGGGPRNCVGAAFAQIETKIVLARILQSFHLEPAGLKVKIHMGATLEPRPGVTMRVTQRETNACRAD